MRLCCVLGGVSRLGLGLVWVGVSFAFGLTGKVENGPSCTERLLGGLPRSLPEVVLVVDGHALETAGPCLLRLLFGDLLELVEGWADLGSSNAKLAENAFLGVIADWGYGEEGVSLLAKRHRVCWPIL